MTAIAIPICGLRACIALGLAGVSFTAAAAFGLTQDSSTYTVDSGAGLVFKVNRTNGDINSIRMNGGVELLGQTKGSHISSGLGAVPTATATAAYVLVTIPTATLTHYLAVRPNQNVIYMATSISAEPSVGELRWVTRLNSSVFKTRAPEAPIG